MLENINDSLAQDSEIPEEQMKAFLENVRNFISMEQPEYSVEAALSYKNELEKIEQEYKQKQFKEKAKYLRRSFIRHLDSMIYVGLMTRKFKEGLGKVEDFDLDKNLDDFYKNVEDILGSEDPDENDFEFLQNASEALKSKSEWVNYHSHDLGVRAYTPGMNIGNIDQMSESIDVYLKKHGAR